MTAQQAKFTKGPWLLQDAIEITDADGNAIANAQPRNGEELANATLIAAAPAMYALLEELRDNYVQYPAAIAKIDALLEKTRGAAFEDCE